ncbi:VacB-like exoribonuclease II [Metamycoplasma arthritidis]|uniref:Ribonuclease R n=1 Tax=Metamycoplasma arthritidis (strain 158L3-1) TaxID=243272 RepID=B3PMK9_META1|nr:ribonuclease R [Metamycoplasma arthritidis]ACF07261.1 VacB-like exoribonuclease II [Metamycoplasma arthritidis 158L3-1]VEU78784.1 VacB-like exoribonuclease II [Metamycoplasma arthritidis]
MFPKKRFNNKPNTINIKEEDVLNLIKKFKTLSFLKIAKELKLKSCDNHYLTKFLYSLLDANKIDKTKNGDFYLLNYVCEVENQISITNKRLGFIDLDNALETNNDENKCSAFVAPFQLKNVLDKDLVQAKIYSYQDENNKTLYKGVISNVIKHNCKNIIGFIEFKENRPIFNAFDERNKANFFFINTSNFPKIIKSTDLVKCIILEPNAKSVAIAFDSIITNLNDKNYVIKKIMAANDVKGGFGLEVLEKAATIPQEIIPEDYDNRVDLTSLLTVTIDGLDTKDFDDAISCSKLENGNYKLFIHIADVSHYVKEGDAIDKEALERGTSIYLPDKVIPMLPFALSNGICSLNPNVIRACLTLELELDNHGKNVSSKVYASLIKSDYRLTYNEVNDFFNQKIEVPNEINNLLSRAREISKILRAKKIKDGYVDFEIEEPKIIMEDNDIKDIVIRKDGEAEKLIEDFMVRANETIAEMMKELKIPSIYRIHDKPETLKLSALQELLGFVGMKNIQVPFDGSPKSFEIMVNKIKAIKLDDYLKMALLRTMQKAQYSSNNIGHFGLASSAYSHFTSPIRRYPDLLLHRLIRKYILNGKFDPKNYEKVKDEIEAIAQMNSEAEKTAMTVERSVVDVMKSKFFEKFINKTFVAQLVSIEKFGAFFNIEEYQASVLIRFEDDEDGLIKISSYEAKGKSKTLKVGSEYKIAITSIDHEKGNINAKLV